MYSRRTRSLFTTVICPLVLALVPVALSAQTGRVEDDLSLESKILKGDRRYAIYLPPGYQSSHRSYPVLYLLHGSGDDQTGWVQFGEVEHILDKAINDGSATPMIVVMPDANTGRRGYWNDITGVWRYEDFFFQEFIPYVEKTYRIKGEKRYRAIAGLSMGGRGTFLYALHHPEMFSSACPLSAATGPMTPADTRADLIKFSQPPPATPPDSLTLAAYFKTQSVLYMVENMPESQKKAVRWFIDCGDQDNHLEANSAVVNAMYRGGIPREFRVREGAHNWTYWRASLPEVLRFVSDAFHQY